MHRPGLKHIPTERLRELLKVVHAGKLGLPVSMPNLMLAGFGDCGDEMQVLYGLDQNAVRAALVIALAERSA